MKKCTQCKEIKPFEEFSKNSSAKDKLMWHCKQCARKRFVPKKIKRIVIERDKWTCQNCGQKVHDDLHWLPDKCHVDHIIPVSKGGSNDLDNLQVLCQACNLTKSKKVRA